MLRFSCSPVLFLLRRVHCVAFIFLMICSVVNVGQARAESLTAPFAASVDTTTPVLSIGNDRYFIVEDEAAYIWDARAAQGYRVPNMGRWNHPKAVALGSKVLIVGSRVGIGQPLAKDVLKREGRVQWPHPTDLLLYDPKSETGVAGKLNVGAYGSTLAAISDTEAWVVGGYDQRVVERVTVDTQGQLHVGRMPDRPHAR